MSSSRSNATHPLERAPELTMDISLRPKVLARPRLVQWRFFASTLGSTPQLRRRYMCTSGIEQLRQHSALQKLPNLNPGLLAMLSESQVS